MEKRKERNIRTLKYRYSCKCNKCGWRFPSLFAEYRMCPACFEKKDIKVLKRLHVVV